MKSRSTSLVVSASAGKLVPVQPSDHDDDGDDDDVEDWLDVEPLALAPYRTKTTDTRNDQVRTRLD